MRTAAGATITALLLGLGACSGGGSPQPAAGAPMQAQSAMAPAPPERERSVGAANDGAAVDGRQNRPVGQTAPLPATLPMLAYSYSQTLEAPNARVGGLMRRHEQACAAAGPTVCQVFGSTLSTDRENGAVRGTLELRAQPAWLTTFRAGLEGQARAAGGRSLSSGTQTEDLTRSIVDSEATLRAQTTLRDRLQELLATRDGRLADMLQIETELARVQGQIDATQSELAVMRTRVATSALTISYQSETAAVGEGTFEPLSDALGSFVRNLVRAVAVMVVLVSVLLPFALLGGLILWLVLFGRRRGWMKRSPRPARATSPPVV